MGFCHTFFRKKINSFSSLKEKPVENGRNTHDHLCLSERIQNINYLHRETIVLLYKHRFLDNLGLKYITGLKSYNF